MTAARTAFDLGAAPPAHAGGRTIPHGPAEGWSSLVLLALMAALVGWVIDDSRWVFGDQRLTDFLPYAGIGGVLAGFVAAKVGWGRLTAHLVGATFAALFLGFAVGAQLAPGGTPHDLFVAAGASVTGAWYDLVVLGRGTTSEVGHYLFIVGGLCWGTGQYAAYTAIAHRRPVSAVLLPGAVLLANVSLTVRDQFPVLVVFTLAALLALVRLHVVDEERAWFRHRIGDVGGATGAYLRAGFMFVAVTVVGSLLLTNIASSAPLSGFWQGVPRQLVDLGDRLSRLFPAGGPGTRVGGITFGSTFTIRGQWVTDTTPILRIAVPDDASYRWRAAAYDRFDGTTWNWSDSAEVTVPAGSSLLEGTRDAIEPAVAYREVQFTVSGVSSPPGLLVASGVPLAVDRGTRVTIVRHGADSFYAQVPIGGGNQYVVTAAIPVVDPAQDGAITANRLRVAGNDYPPDLRAMYTAVQDGSVGPRTKALLSTILEQARATNPYDTARAIERYLRDPANFTYDIDVSDVAADCRAAGAVECFVISRHGYCEHYASTMVMMLRLQGIPARLVQGYLPSVPGPDGVQVILRSQAHAWVEAWFPGAGWVDFDPTGGGVGIASDLPAGSPIPSAAPSPDASHPALTPRPTGRGRSEQGGGIVIPPASTGGIGPAIVLVILAIPLGILVFAWWWRRRPARPVSPDVAYRTVERFASRLGHPPRPTQTVYEYLGGLGDALPVARPELQLVATAKVESRYGRKRLSQDRLRALGEAQRRLRLVLLRLGFRRGR